MIQLADVICGSGDAVVQRLIFYPSLLPKVGGTSNSTTFSASFAGLVRTDVQVTSAVVDVMLFTLLFDNHAYTAYLKS